MELEQNFIFLEPLLYYRDKTFYIFTRNIKYDCIIFTSCLVITRSLWDSLRYPCAQDNYATVGLYALCCKNWYRNNSLPFLPLCRHSKKFARVYRLLSKAWPYVNAFCTVKRDSRVVLHYCVATNNSSANSCFRSIAVKRQHFWWML